jgi:outer membrane protein TolC
MKSLCSVRSAIFHLVSFTVLFVSPPASASETPPLFKKIFSAALPKNELGQQKEEEILQADEQKNQATGTLLPAIQALGTELFQQQPSSALGQNISPSNQTIARLNLRQTLFRGTSEYALYRKANRTLEQKQTEAVVERRRLYLDLASRFLAISLAEREKTRLEILLTLYDQQISEMKKRVSIGRSRDTDLLSIESVKATVLSQKIANETLRKNTVREMESLTDLPLQRESFTYDAFRFPALEARENYLTQSENSPEIVTAKIRTQSVEEDISAAHGQHLPQLELGGNYWLKRQGALRDVKWDLSLNLTIPIFAGGVIQSQVREASSRYRVTQILESKALRETRLQVENLYRTLEDGEPQLSALQNSVSLSERTLNRMRQEYRLGLLTLLDVLNATQVYQTSTRALDQFKHQQLLTRLQLEVLANRLNP